LNTYKRPEDISVLLVAEIFPLEQCEVKIAIIKLEGKGNLPKRTFEKAFQAFVTIVDCHTSQAVSGA
jgi:hypothetical protein